jgi:6-phosphogluconolactonase
MKIQVLADADAVAREAAALIAAQARESAAAGGRFILAVSGGHTPWIMLRELAGQEVPWENLHLVQVDERIAPPDHADRNLTHLRESLLTRVALDPDQIHAMPVEMDDLERAANQYSRTLSQVAGSPPILDLVHLGLGPDGHTASLVPGDPVLNVTDADVALTGVYQGRRRMTLTYPIINRARRILWLVTGADKAGRSRACVPPTPEFRPGGFTRTRPSCSRTALRLRTWEQTRHEPVCPPHPHPALGISSLSGSPVAGDWLSRRLFADQKAFHFLAVSFLHDSSGASVRANSLGLSLFVLEARGRRRRDPLTPQQDAGVI